MAISKVILNGVTQMDVTQDTVAASNLLSGYTATGADGQTVNGAYVPSGGTMQSKSVTPTTAAQTVTPDQGYDGLSSVEVGAIPDVYLEADSPEMSYLEITPSTSTQYFDPREEGELIYQGDFTPSYSGTSATGTIGTVFADGVYSVILEIYTEGTGGYGYTYAFGSFKFSSTRTIVSLTCTNYDGDDAHALSCHITKDGRFSAELDATPSAIACSITIYSVDYIGYESAYVYPIPPQYIVPTGTLEITRNGTYNVSQYASVTVTI